MVQLEGTHAAHDLWGSSALTYFPAEQVVFVLTPHHVDVYDISTRERIGRDSLDIHNVVSHDYYSTAFDASRSPSESLSYSASFTTHKKKVFLLVCL